MAYLKSGGAFLKTGAGTRLASGGVPAGGGFTRTSRGLILADDFSDLAAWSSEGTWASVIDRALIAYPIPRYMVEPTPGSPDAGGVREPHFVDVGGGVFYMFYGGPDGSGTPGSWLAQLAKSTNRGKTWTKLGVQVGLAKGFTPGNWAGRDYGFMHKVGGTYYLHVVDADAVTGGDVPGLFYEDSVYTATSIEGPWTYSARGPARIGGGYNSLSVCGPCVVFDGSVYHYFYSAWDGTPVPRIGRATCSTPNGTWTDQGSVIPDALKGNPENPKVFWSRKLSRWVMLNNQVNGGLAATEWNHYFLSESLTDWSGATTREFFQYAKWPGWSGQTNTIDTTQGDVIGLASPLYNADGTVAFDGDIIPFAYDAYPTDSNHHGRRILGGVLEPNLSSLGYSGTTIKEIQTVAAHTDFVAEFALNLTAQTNAGGQIAFLYRRDNNLPTVNGYQFSFVPSPSGSAGVYLYKIASSSPTLLTSNTNAKMQFANTYRIRIEVSGTSHKCFINGVLVIDATDATFVSGATFAFKGYECTGTVRGFHIRKSNTVAITGAGSAVSLHAPGGIYVTEDAASLVHTHYPMRALGLGATYTEFSDGVYGGDEYAFA